MSELAFLSRILASATHDMQNIMAIIKECGALAEDILSLNKIGPRLKHGDKLASSFSSLSAQVERGRALLIALNTLAHAAAAEYPQTDGPLFCQRGMELARRMARLKECTLAAGELEKGVLILGDAFLFMETLYLGVALALTNCTAGNALTVDLFREGDAACLRITTGEPVDIPQPDGDLEALLARLNASGTCAPGALSFSFPAATA